MAYRSTMHKSDMRICEKSPFANHGMLIILSVKLSGWGKVTVNIWGKNEKSYISVLKVNFSLFPPNHQRKMFYFFSVKQKDSYIY